MSQLELERGSNSESREMWVELASRQNDGLHAVLYTLGELAMTDTPAYVQVEHKNGVSLHREGPLHEVAQVYHHPMVYVTSPEAEIAYPPAA